MGGILGFGIIILLMLVVVLPLFSGGRIRKYGNYYPHGSERTTLGFLALNMMEPAINVFVMSGLLVVIQPDFFEHVIGSSGPIWDSFGAALAVTFPVSILLLPVLGWNDPHSQCRRINRSLVFIGLIRWGITAFTFIWLPAIILGLVVFIASLVWVNAKAKQITSLGGKAIGVGPDGVTVGELSDFSQSHQPEIRV